MPAFANIAIWAISYQMSDTFSRIVELVSQERVRLSDHSEEEILEDLMNLELLLGGVAAAKVVEDYADAFKGPSVLLLQDHDGRPVHVVWGLAKAKPDGATLLVANVGITSINPALYAKLPYNPDTAFTPISLVCELPFVLMASPAFAPNSVKELIAYSKGKPGQVTFASSGSGGSPHLTAEIFQAATGTKWTHIPYKGGGPAMIDLMSGQVNLLFASVLEGSGHIKAGKLKGLAVSHAKRNPAIPDVPTLAEAGVKDAESGSWIALLAPAGVSPSVIEKINSDVKDAVAVPEVREKLIAQGAVPQASTPKELQALIDADLKRYGRIIREQNLKEE